MIRTLCWKGIDLLFPVPTPLSGEETKTQHEQLAARTAEDERLVRGLPDDGEQLTLCLASCKDLLVAEHDRRQSVETRLTTIIGLSSIAGTIVIGTMLTQRAGANNVLEPFLLLYLALQVCSAILAAVFGLGRRGYLEATASDVLPDGAETSGVYLRRQIGTCLDVLRDDRELNNEKVTYMAVAHRAMTQFVVGIVLLALLGTWHSFTGTAQDELVDRLRIDHALQELLRGPQGAPGAPGPAGAPCTTISPSKPTIAKNTKR